MMAFPSPLGHKGPTLETLHMVETVLRKSPKPLSLNRIKALVPRKVMHRTLREAIEHYKRLGLVTEGSRGVMWTAVGEARPPEGLDLDGLPTFADDDPKVSRHHDKYLYG